MRVDDDADGVAQAPDGGQSVVSAPQISLPKGGGAIRGIGEKFSANPVTGAGSLLIPIYASPGRAGLGPQLRSPTTRAPAMGRSASAGMYRCPKSGAAKN